MATRSERVAAAVPGWGVSDVLAWLVSRVPAADDSVRLAFETNAIDGAALLELTSANLQDDLGVSQLGVRLAILRGIAELQEGGPAEGEPPTAERAASEAARLAVEGDIAVATRTGNLALFDEAIAALEAAFALDPTNILAQNNLESVRIEKGVVEALGSAWRASGRPLRDKSLWSREELKAWRDSEFVSTVRTFRTVDGTGNNLRHPRFGCANEPLRRVSPPAYADGTSQPSSRVPAAGLDEATPRRISNLVCKGESAPSRDNLSAFVWAWGQFLDHELDLTEAPEHDKEALPLKTPTALEEESFPTGETVHDHAIPFTRSRSTLDGEGVAQQTNQITSFIDASNVYGSDAARATALRALDGTGRLRTSQAANGEDLCPLNDGASPAPNAMPPGSDPSSFFLAGDVRANENVLLIGMHALFVREHNFWCQYAAAAFPQWAGADELLYQHARRMVTGIMQQITYGEFLPALLGRGSIGRYRGYDPEVDASVSTEFATAAYRFGHSMVGSRVRTGRDDTGLPLRDAFFKPEYVQQHGADNLLVGACFDEMLEVDGFVVEDLRSFLFNAPGVPAGMMHDLAALNIQRGRDHGLGGYCAVRAAFGLPVPSSFEDIDTTPERKQALARLYDRPDDIDPWVGGLVETHADGAAVGPLIQAVLAEQFDRLRHGDFFWFQNDDALPPWEKQLIQRTTLADVLRRNVKGGGEFPDDCFRTSVPDAPTPSGLRAPFEFVDTQGDLILISGEPERPWTPFDGAPLPPPHRWLSAPSHGVENVLLTSFDDVSGGFLAEIPGRGVLRGTMPPGLIFWYRKWEGGELFEFTDTDGAVIRIAGPAGQWEEEIGLGSAFGPPQPEIIWSPRTMEVLITSPELHPHFEVGAWGGWTQHNGSYRVGRARHSEDDSVSDRSGTVPVDHRPALQAFESSRPQQPRPRRRHWDPERPWLEPAQPVGCVAAPAPALFSTNHDGIGVELLQSDDSVRAATPAQVSALVDAVEGARGSPSVAAPQSFPDCKLLDATARSALMRHVDEHHLTKAGGDKDLRLALSQAQLEALIGADSTRHLFDFFGAEPNAIRLRRVEAGDGPACVQFHTDYSLRTMQVPLNDAGEYEGGSLVWAVDGALEMPARSAGSATIHTKGVVHGVTALKRGTRYGLFLCELPDENVDLLYLTDVATEQLRFFGPAMAYLDNATDAELRECAAEYHRFLLESLHVDGTGLGKKQPAPSFEVELFWRTHLLSPVRYARDCAELRGGTDTRLVDHVPLQADAYAAREHSNGSTTNDAAEAPAGMPPAWDSELAAAVRRQARFMRQMLELQRTEATSVKLLTAELENYRTYLLQAASAETELPVPSLMVDLLWHSHMLFPSRYASECMRIAGVLINHDDDL
eukprot:COSAG04_NODE_75_length_28792_cov_4.615272_20_plen_1379_part_00